MLRPRHLRFLTPLLLVFLLSIALPPTAAAAEKKVLLIVNGKSTGAVAGYGNIIASALRAATSDHIDFNEEYTDFWQFSGDSYKDLLHDFYRQKYKDRKFDLVIAQSPEVLGFLLKYGDDLFPRTPIVFGTTNKTQFDAMIPGTASLRPNVTGVLLELDFAATLDLALKLQPELRNVIVISGSSENDASNLVSARKQLNRFENRVKVQYWTDLTMGDLENRLADSPEQSIILYLSINRDASGEAFTPTESLAGIAKNSRMPIYVMVDRLLGSGALGGFVFSVEADAKEVASLAGRVLAGERPSNIPVRVAESNRYEFDWRQIRRWGIKEQNLPAGSHLLFKESSFWELYKWRIAAIAAISILQALLIAGLLIGRIRRRRVEDVRNRLAAIVENSDDAIVSLNMSGTITSWNEGAGRMYGYFENEVVGSSRVDLQACKLEYSIVSPK